MTSTCASTSNSNRCVKVHKARLYSSITPALSSSEVTISCCGPSPLISFKGGPIHKSLWMTFSGTIEIGPQDFLTIMNFSVRVWVGVFVTKAVCIFRLLFLTVFGTCHFKSCKKWWGKFPRRKKIFWSRWNWNVSSITGYLTSYKMKPLVWECLLLKTY